MPRPKTTEFKTKAEYDNWYIKENKERINFVMEKGTKERIKIATAKTGQSSSEFLREAIEEKLTRCGVPKSISIDDPGLKK